MAREITFEVEIRISVRPGPTKAHADVRILLPDGELEIIGFAIIQQHGKPLFVGFPQNKGRDRYFPVVEAKGKTRERIVEAILRSYRDAGPRE